ncbi:TetR/AcrR family transcriptional regulator [Nocardioides sp.]|uniref:TetR/AcrR family transcriptional regulator n=1 Tax=Nocardioides sp. TaxID=35761 RepID=UPI0035144C93
MSTESTARRTPRQDRARERVERILDAAMGLLREHGLTGFTMSAVAERSEMSLGSLYRYFADREALIGALAERYFEVLHEQLAAGLTGLRTREQARDALREVLTGYYAAFRDDAALAALWTGSLTDQRLLALNAADSHRNGALLADRLGPFSTLDDATLLRRCTLASHLTLATVCFALTMEASEGEAHVAEFGSWADELLLADR